MSRRYFIPNLPETEVTIVTPKPRNIRAELARVREAGEKLAQALEGALSYMEQEGFYVVEYEEALSAWREMVPAPGGGVSAGND